MPRKFDLNHPEVQEAKRVHENSYKGNRRIKLSFDELFKMFSVPCITFVMIAEQAQVTSEAISSIYKKRFARFFPTGHRENFGRRKTCTTFKNDGKLKVFSKNSPTYFLAKLAKRRGLTVRPIPIIGKPKPHDYFVEINDKLCYVLTSFKSHPVTPDSKRKYFNYESRRDLTKVDLVCLIAGPNGKTVYIADKNELPISGRIIRFYIPDPKTPIAEGYEGRTPSRDWEKYKNNWTTITGM